MAIPLAEQARPRRIEVATTSHEAVRLEEGAANPVAPSEEGHQPAAWAG